VLQDDGWWETFVADASGDGHKAKLFVQVGRRGPAQAPAASPAFPPPLPQRLPARGPAPPPGL
jgi:hypothetical protein